MKTYAPLGLPLARARLLIETEVTAIFEIAATHDTLDRPETGAGIGGDMGRAYFAIGWGVVFIGAVHMFATTQIFPEVSAPAVWFFGAGIAMALTGALNLLNSASGYAAPGVKKVCVAANIFMTLFAVVAGRVTNASVVERVVIVGLVGSATVLSVLKRSSSPRVPKIPAVTAI